MTAAISPTVLISWAHRNPDWTSEQAQQWEDTVRAFAELLVKYGVGVELDLWYLHDSGTDWTRFGQDKVRASDFVLIAVTAAWRERWEGKNKPTEGAGAVAEADTLKGLFEEDQEAFQRKAMIAILPGSSGDNIPSELRRLSRFPIDELTRAGVDDLLRTLFRKPRYVRPALGAVPDLAPEEPAQPVPLTSASAGEPRAAEPATGGAQAGNVVASVVGDRNTVTIGGHHIHHTHLGPTTPRMCYAEISRDAYLDRLDSASRSRREDRRSGVGLSSEQVARSLTFPVSIPSGLRDLATGETKVLVGALGSGKSDIAEEWLRESLALARRDVSAPVPVWVPTRVLDGALTDYIANVIGDDVLARLGADIVVDGLDECTEMAATLLRHATEFVAKWPKSRIVLTSRAEDEVNKHVALKAPLLSREDANRLMALVAGRRLGTLGEHLEEAVGRPFFALLAARHAAAAEGAASTRELIDLVVEDTVEAEGFDLYTGLRQLAVETIRSGKPVDPARFATTDVAAQIRQSSLVTTSGKTCVFSLAIFEQWFAAKGVLERAVQVEDLMTSLRSFDRWRYVFAMVLAAGEPARVDPVMAALARWNPGAASWVVEETVKGGVSRQRPDIGPEDWEETGHRLRLATAAWLDGLGPLSDAFSPYSAMQASVFDAVTVAVDIEHQLRVAWLVSKGHSGDHLPPVISAQHLPRDRTVVYRGHVIPTGLNWVWQVSRNHLAGDLTDRFVALAQRIGVEHPGVAQQEAKEAFGPGLAAFPWFHDSASRSPSSTALYPLADIRPTQELQWGAFKPETMLERARQIFSAAMACYCELAATVAPRFEDTLGHRGLMPVQFYGDVFYDPHRERAAFDFPGPDEPAISWLLKPIGRPAPDGRRTGGNAVSLTLNDDARADEIKDDRDVLYGSFREYLEAYPAYEPFATSFATHVGRFELLSDRPATRIALSWLWDDLKRLGWVHGSFPRNA